VVAGQVLTTRDDEHDPEGVTIGFERARLLGLLPDRRSDLGAPNRAADRIAAGTYGECLRCGELIPAEWLEPLPAAETLYGVRLPPAVSCVLVGYPYRPFHDRHPG
jgi:hypothetical protein